MSPLILAMEGLQLKPNPTKQAVGKHSFKLLSFQGFVINIWTKNALFVVIVILL